MNEAVRDLKIGYLSKIVTEQSDMNYDDLWNQLVLDYPENLQLYMAKLTYLDEHPNRHENLAAIIVAANDIISRISEDDLAKCLGRRVDLENGDSIQVRYRNTFSFNFWYSYFGIEIRLLTKCCSTLCDRQTKIK